MTIDHAYSHGWASSLGRRGAHSSIISVPLRGKCVGRQEYVQTSCTALQLSLAGGADQRAHYRVTVGRTSWGFAKRFLDLSRRRNLYPYGQTRRREIGFFFSQETGKEENVDHEIDPALTALDF